MRILPNDVSRCLAVKCRRKPNAGSGTRKAKSRTKIAGWMFNGILKASPDMGTAVLSGWMKAQIRSMTWSCYSHGRVAEIAKETAAQLSIYERIIQRRVDGWYKKENERIAKMYQEVGL